MGLALPAGNTKPMVTNLSIHAGAFISATPILNGSIFENARILIVRVDDTGATGFVVSKLFNRRFNELTEFSDYPAFPMYEGGPVDPEHLYFIHRRPALITDGVRVSDDIYFGGNFHAAINLLKTGTISSSDVKILVGYCGWDNGELETEIEEGNWIITDHSSPFD